MMIAKNKFLIMHLKCNSVSGPSTGRHSVHLAHKNYILVYLSLAAQLKLKDKSSINFRTYMISMLHKSYCHYSLCSSNIALCCSHELQKSTIWKRIISTNAWEVCNEKLQANQDFLLYK